jgi:hypothetical protein
MQLTEVEPAFRTLKSELAIRPLFHQLEKRAAPTVPPRAVRLSLSPHTHDFNARRFSVRLLTAPPYPDVIPWASSGTPRIRWL